MEPVEGAVAIFWGIYQERHVEMALPLQGAGALADGIATFGHGVIVPEDGAVGEALAEGCLDDVEGLFLQGFDAQGVRLLCAPHPQVNLLLEGVHAEHAEERAEKAASLIEVMVGMAGAPAACGEEAFPQDGDGEKGQLRVLIGGGEVKCALAGAGLATNIALCGSAQCVCICATNLLGAGITRLADFVEG